VKFLARFPEYQEFKSRRKTLNDQVPVEIQVAETLTPEEVLAEAHQELDRDLGAVLLDRVKQVPPAFLAQLMMEHGVGVTTVAMYAVQRVDPDYFEGME
jgi:restriction endonuclease Mrr